MAVNSFVDSGFQAGSGLAQEYLLAPVQEAVSVLTVGAAELVPALIGAILLYFLGGMVIRFLTSLAKKGLELIQFDTWMGKVGVTEMTERVNMTPSGVVAKVVYWVFYVVLIQLVLGVLGFQAAVDIIDGVIALIPDFLAGAVVLSVVIVLARVVSDLIKSATTASGLVGGGIMARVASVMILFTGSVVALDIVGVPTDIVTDNLTVLIAGAAGVMALAFGLGGRSSAENLLGSLEARHMLATGDKVTIGDVSGTVEAFGTTHVCLKTSDGMVWVPGSSLTASQIKKG